MIQGRPTKSAASYWRKETTEQNMWSYHMPVMVGTNVSRNNKHNIYNEIVQGISWGLGDHVTKLYPYVLISLLWESQKKNK